jgi:hypothetical protein
LVTGSLNSILAGKRAPKSAVEAMMAKVWAVLAVLVSILLVAPVIESGTQTTVPVFQAVGDACDGGGGGF